MTNSNANLAVPPPNINNKLPNNYVSTKIDIFYEKKKILEKSKKKVNCSYFETLKSFKMTIEKKEYMYSK